VSVAAAGDAAVGGTECDGEQQTTEDVPDLSASERSEVSENKASASTEGPDSSDVTTPDSAGNVNTVPSVDAAVDQQTDAARLNTDAVTPSVLSPINSPVHIVRTLITQHDPLGVFTNTVTSTSSKTATDPRPSRSSDDVVKSALMDDESVLMRRISEDAIGRTSWVAAATDSSLRKCSSLNRLSSESARSSTSTTTSAVGHSAAGSTSSSPRTSLLGGTFRSAASRFASKYLVIRESMVPPPSQPAKVVGPDEPGGERCAAACDAVPTAVVSDSSDVTSPETAVGAENTDAVSKTMPDSTAVAAQAGKSRLRVPTALYSPLGKYLMMFLTCRLLP